MVRAAGTCQMMHSRAPLQGARSGSVAELKNMLTAFHKDKLSGSSSDGAIKIIIEGGWFTSAMHWQFSAVLGRGGKLRGSLRNMNFLSWVWAQSAILGLFYLSHREKESCCLLSMTSSSPSAASSPSNVVWSLFCYGQQCSTSTLLAPMIPLLSFVPFHPALSCLFKVFKTLLIFLGHMPYSNTSWRSTLVF